MSTDKITFETFVLSLGTATMISLGEVENPVLKKKDVNIESAKQNIELLELMKIKTAGNLDEREAQILDGILYEARMKFVEKTKESHG